MARKENYATLFLWLVVACALVRAHTVSVCYKLDQCTGQYEAAYGTYHSIGEFSNGCSGNPSGKCPSGFSIIDGNSVPFDSLVLADGSGYPDEPGWDPSDCFTCPTYNNGISGNRVWQKASVILSPGSHSVTVAATSAIESPWSSCFPITLNVGGTVSSSISCPASQSISQSSYPSCSSTASFSSATCSIDTATCPGFVCSVTQNGGPASGSTFPVGTTTVSWLLNVNGNPTTQTCNHNVVVTDDTAPQNIACPSDVSTTCTGSTGATASWTGGATADDCSTITWSQSHNSGDLFPIGNTVVTYTATDASSRTSSCTFNVDIVSGGPPTWTRNCPSDILVTSFTPGSSGSATVSWQAPLANDGCATSLAVTQTGGPASGSSFDVVDDNPTTITYQTAADPVSGQQISCSFVVSFGFASLTRIDQLGQLDVPRLVMYIPFDVTVAFVNIPVQSGAGRLWISDGTRQLNVPMNEDGQATFDTATLTNGFRGPYGLMPGQVTVWITVDGNPFYFGNQLTMELVAAY